MNRPSVFVALGKPRRDGTAAGLDRLRRALALLRAGESLPEELAAWLADGLEAFATRGENLTSALGLRPRPGDWASVAHRHLERERRDNLLRAMILVAPGGSDWERCSFTAQVLAGQAQANDDMAGVRRELGAVKVPTTVRQLYAIWKWRRNAKRY